MLSPKVMARVAELNFHFLLIPKNLGSFCLKLASISSHSKSHLIPIRDNFVIFIIGNFKYFRNSMSEKRRQLRIFFQITVSHQSTFPIG